MWPDFWQAKPWECLSGEKPQPEVVIMSALAHMQTWQCCCAGGRRGKKRGSRHRDEGAGAEQDREAEASAEPERTKRKR